MTIWEVTALFVLTGALLGIIFNHIQDRREGRLPGQRWNRQTKRWED